ncbi:S1 family peptidase [Janibacter sp. GXQ6167]|uniref:S1 family peptidase n=1 Tax=Janibacter sp. GXQ6167 TaxID=3240791 RepID=UPI003523190C
MKVRIPLAVGGAIALGITTLSASTAHANPDPDPTEKVATQDPVTDYIMKRENISKKEAKEYVDTKRDRQAALDRLERQGISTDGAYFDDTKLVVVVKDAAASKKVRAAGLTPSRAAGQSTLDARAKKVLKAAGARSKHILTVGPNLPKGTVDVRVSKDAPSALVSSLKAMEGVTVTVGDKLETHADVVPGQIMRLSSGGNCSLGYTGTDRNGRAVLLTAGHCVESLPRVFNAAGQLLGQGTHSRFRTGSSSVDMGLMTISAGNRGIPQVDSRGHSGMYPVRGLSKGAIGTDICKAGNTTGWTCGQIKAYNRTVNYDGTVVSGLAEASVCSQGGDSGGAYLGAGNLAQGMTSGGPVGVRCGFNRGYAAGSYSFYQPVVDAANYYGVTLNTMR